MGIIEDIKKQLEPYDVVRKINALESKMRAIEDWKVNSVSPQLRDLLNATKDNASKALNAATQASDAAKKAVSALSLSQNAVSQSQSAISVAQSAIGQANDAVESAYNAANMAIDAKNDSGDALNDARAAMKEAVAATNQAVNAANDATVNIQNWINTEAIPNINAALTGAQQALTEAQTAAQQAIDASGLAEAAKTLVEDAQTKIFAIRDVFVNIGTKIQARITRIQTLIGEVNTVIITGMESIRVKAHTTANKFQRWGDVLTSDGYAIYLQALDAIDEIAVPLERIKHYTDILANPNIFDLPFTFFNVYAAFAHLSFATYGGQGSVVAEIQEGFNQTFRALNTMGGHIKSGFYEIRDTFKATFDDMKSRFNTISGKLTELNNEILGMFNDIQTEIAKLG